MSGSDIFPFGGKYLRVLTPKTTNGTTPMMDENDRLVFKETHLPMTAKKDLERQNETLSKELQHRITVVDSSIPVMSKEQQAVIDKKNRAAKLKKELAELEAEEKAAEGKTKKTKAEKEAEKNKVLETVDIDEDPLLQ